MHGIGWVYMQGQDVDVWDQGFTLYICGIRIELALEVYRIGLHIHGISLGDLWDQLQGYTGSALEVYGIGLHIHGISLGDLWDWLQGCMGLVLEMYGIRLYIYVGLGMQTYGIGELTGDQHGIGRAGSGLG